MLTFPPPAYFRSAALNPLFSGGVPGELLRTEGTEWQLMAVTYEEQDNISALTVLDGQVFGATADNGLLLRSTETPAPPAGLYSFDPSTDTRSLAARHIAGQNQMYSFAVANGKLYASVGTSGLLVELAGVQETWTSLQSNNGSAWTSEASSTRVRSIESLTDDGTDLFAVCDGNLYKLV
jgi:hypothetical protein